jgi:D-alanyl-D-alanine carboxypeptidase
VPWQAVAQAQGTQPAIAGFSLPQVTPTPRGQFAALAPVPKTVQSDDEDAAESVRAPDENFSVIHAETAKPRPAVPAKPAVAPAPKPVVVANVAHPSPRPETRPDGFLAAQQAGLVKVAVNAPKPQMRPSLKEDVGEGDQDVTPSPGHNWTIQIGAYADKALAAAQLKAYAGKASDVLARASQIISPSQTASGHTLYRARFGLYAEQEARDVCSRLTQRGQTCFAAVQTR